MKIAIAAEGTRGDIYPMLALAKRGYVAQAIVGFLRVTARALWAFLSHPVGALATVALLTWSTRGLRRRWRDRRAHRRNAGTDPRHEIRTAYRDVEKRLRRKGWIRETGTTLRQFAAAVAAEKVDLAVTVLADRPR